MKKVLPILIGLISFTGGVFIFYIYPLITPIPLYELKGEKIESYKDRKIRVIGYFTPEKAESTYFFNLQDFKGNCFEVDLECSAYVSLELSNVVKQKNILLIDEITDQNSQLGKTDFRRGIFGARVEIIGYVDEKPNPFGGTVPLIKVEQIKKISETKFISFE